MSFAKAIQNEPDTRTTNGMKSYTTTKSANVDLFYKIGASRGKDITATFAKAYAEDRVKALRILFWARDIRQGAGERQLFRQCMKWLEVNAPDELNLLIGITPTYGRWDDLLEFETQNAKDLSFALIAEALTTGNGLAAKWMPRKGDTAIALRNFMCLSPKKYRKLLVNTTKVVEQQMCAKKWDGINYSHVPSVAAARYQRAFAKHDPEGYKKYRDELAKPVETRNPKVKINAGAVYPYDVIKSMARGDAGVAQAQWDALPNYVGEASILPVVDVSGSMMFSISQGLTALDVSVSLGLYLADKCRGAFKDVFCTFSSESKLQVLKGNLTQKLQQINAQDWGMSTDLNKAFENILNVATKGNVSREDMPKYVLVLSDMQFNQCAKYDDKAIDMIRRKYEMAGYECPNVIFWNLNNSNEDVPVKFNEKGVALVSGFSPSIMLSILAAKTVTPEDIMLETLNSERYAIIK